MRTNTLVGRLITPHHAIKDPGNRRLVLLLSAYHLLTIPIGPLVYFIRPTLPLIWVGGITTMCLCFYLLSRGPWATQLFFVQIVCALAIPALTSIIEPNRQSVHFAYMVPVLVSTLLYPLRYLYIVSILSVSCFLSMTHFFPGDDPTLRQGSFLLLLVLIAMVVMSKHYNRWIEQHRELRKQENRQKYLSLLNATFDGIAICSNGVFITVSEGFASVFSESTESIEGVKISAFLQRTLKSTEEIGQELKHLEN